MRVTIDGVETLRMRSPGRVAENGSRKDGIRAGAVSGPWRSGAAAGPRRPAPAAPAAEREAVEFAPAALVRAAAPAAAPIAAPVASPAPAPAAEPEAPVEAARVAEPVAEPLAEPAPVPAAKLEPAAPVAPAAAPSPGLRALRRWSAAAGLFGVGITVAALLLRPDGSEASSGAVEAARPALAVETPVVTAALESPAAAPVATAPAAPATPATATVYVRVGPETPEELRAAVVAALREAGYGSVELRPMPFPIVRPRVGYFDAADAGGAAALAAALAPLDGMIGGRAEVRDYVGLVEAPIPGRFDVWIGG